MGETGDTEIYLIMLFAKLSTESIDSWFSNFRASLRPGARNTKAEALPKHSVSESQQVGPRTHGKHSSQVAQ